MSIIIDTILKVYADNWTLEYDEDGDYLFRIPGEDTACIIKEPDLLVEAIQEMQKRVKEIG